MKKIHDVACNENIVFENLMLLVDIVGKDILEVGGCFPKDIIFKHGINKWVSVDPKIPFEVCEKQYVALKGEILCFDSKDESFDIIFSANAFQYLPNFKQTMAYLHRLLKDKGRLFAHFGPIWSSPDGSSFENLILSNGQVINFWENNILPKWYHLLYSECELRKIISNYFSQEDTKKIIDFIFHSSQLNRLFLNDYIEIFKATGFKIILIKTTDLLDYNLKSPIENNIPDADIKKRLTEMYGSDNYDCRDVMVLLEK